MSVSIKDVAKSAGVSRMTISRVMRNESVRPETRRRVLKIMQELGYVPSRAARALRASDPLRAMQANCFALVFAADTQAADDFFCEVSRGAEAQAAEFGLCALQVHWLEDIENSWLRMQTVLAIEGLCGVILIGQFSAREVLAIQRVNPNLVIVDGDIPAGVKVAAVAADNLGGCALALTHLADCKARRPLILTGPEDHYFSKALLAAAQTHADKFATIEIIHTDYTFASARRQVAERLAGGLKFDAVFGNDILCLGAMKTLDEKDISVPQAVKVVGFDDIPACEYLTPTLTSIQIDKRGLGSEAVKILVATVRGATNSHHRTLTLGATLQRRESTRDTV